MRAACESILPPICETLQDILSKVEPDFQDKVRNNVILAGGSSLISGLTDAIQKSLAELGGGRATVVKDPVFAGCDGGLAIARDARVRIGRSCRCKFRRRNIPKPWKVGRTARLRSLPA